jgi:ABC-type sugar transport system ATPase subunit
VGEAARILQLEPLLKRRPKELSGGQRQRVAIGRAIVRQPKVFLFDEPLSNLDAALRINTRVEIAKLHKLLKATIVYVTHDQVEAMTLADKIVVMNQGRVEQVGKPLELYYRPANLFVARFIGSPAMNTVAAEVTDSRHISVAGGTFALAIADTSLRGPVTMGFRPEHCSIGKSGIPAKVDIVERLGETGYVHCRTADGAMILVEVKGDPALAQGANVNVSPAPEHLHLFDTAGMRIATA